MCAREGKTPNETESAHGVLIVLTDVQHNVKSLKFRCVFYKEMLIVSSLSVAGV